MTQILSLFLVSMISSFFLINAAYFVFQKYGILDNPAKYQKKRKPIPYSMWVVFFIAFFILTAAFVEFSDKLLLIWIFGWIITLVSFFDDLFNVSPKLRLLFQIIIWAIIWVTSIKIGYVSNIFGWIIDLETYAIEIVNMKIYIIPLLFTIIWYVFVFNAFNWADGIEWNTSWLGIISFFVLFLLGLILFERDNYSWGIQNAIFIIQLSIILVAIIIPFWYYDIREKILMWDSGTMFLGFMLATLAIIAWGKIATVLVVFGIYSVDAVYVIIKRLYNKKNPLKWDFSHLHHRLLNIWLTKRQVLYTVYSLSLLFWVTALFLDKIGKIIVFLVIVIIVVFMNKIIELWKKIK